jgi:hypothetical protein
MSRDRAEQLIEAGIWLGLAGDHEGARGLYLRALKLDPGNARATTLLRGVSPQPPIAAPVALEAQPSPTTAMTSPAPAAEEPEVPWVAVSELQTSVPSALHEPAQEPATAGPRGPVDSIWDAVAPPAQEDSVPADARATEEGVRVVVAAAHESVGQQVPGEPPAPTLEGDWGAIAGGDDGSFSPGPLKTPPPMFGAGTPSAFEPTAPAPRTTLMQFRPAPVPASGAGAPRSTLVQYRPSAAAQAPEVAAPRTTLMQFRPVEVAAAAAQANLADLGAALTASGPLLSPPTGASAEREAPQPRFVMPSLDQLVPGGPGPEAPPGPPIEPRQVGQDPAAREAHLEPSPAPAPADAKPAWAWGNIPPPDVPPADWAAQPEHRPSPWLAPTAESAWDQRTNPGIKLEEVEGRGRALDLISSDSKISRPPAERTEELRGLLRKAKDLLELDDHTGAMEFISKAQAIAPDDLEVQMLRERSERTLLTMYESKLGHLDATPRVLLKDDEIIWLNLDHRAGFVLAQIDGTVTFEDLFSVSGMSRFDTARILAQLVDEGVITRG